MFEKSVESKAISEYDSESGLSMFLFEINAPPKLSLKQIAWQIKPYAPTELLRGPIEMHISFFLPIPKHIVSHRRKSMQNNVIKHAIRPNLGNLTHKIEQAMVGLVYLDHAQICATRHEKQWSDNPRVVVKVFEI